MVISENFFSDPQRPAEGVPAQEQGADESHQRTHLPGGGGHLQHRECPAVLEPSPMCPDSGVSPVLTVCLQIKAALKSVVPAEQKYIEEEPKVSKQVSDGIYG